MQSEVYQERIGRYSVQVVPLYVVGKERERDIKRVDLDKETCLYIE